jgi:hypothetical protein
MTDRDSDRLPAEPATPDDVPDICELDFCDREVDNFPEAFPIHHEVPGVDDTGRAVLCDWHHAAARILAYTRPEHPYVDVALYQECTYYSRALAAETLDIPAEDAVVPPQEYKEDG